MLVTTLKPKSQKTLKTLNNELKKFAPSGASQRRFPSRNETPPGPTDLNPSPKFPHEDLAKGRCPALLTYLDQQKLNPYLHKRHPNKFDAVKRESVVSPTRISTSPPPPSLENLIFERFGRTSPRFLAEEVQVLSGGNSPKVATMDEIISSCQAVSSQGEHKEIPRVLRKYSNQITKLVDGIDNYLVNSKSKE